MTARSRAAATATRQRHRPVGIQDGQWLVAYDTSGVEPALNLNISGDVTWVGGWGINVRSGKAQGSTTASKKLHDMIKATGEYSIEAWVAPGNVAQEDARIVSTRAAPRAQLHAGPDALQLRLLQPLDPHQHGRRPG